MRLLRFVDVVAIISHERARAAVAAASDNPTHHASQVRL